MMQLSRSHNTKTYNRIKRFVDVAGVLILSVVLAPILLVIALLIWVDDGPPIFFSQMRAGQDGRPFRLHKFRTLPTNAPETVQSGHATRVGQILRRWGLDELPQLWNVLRGEMSLVGPRPILLDEAAHYDQRQRERLAVRPGLTGWAQIQGRNALPWHERIERDLWYVRHQSILLDLHILLKTPIVLLSGKGVYGPGNHDPNADDLAAHRPYSTGSKS